MRIAMSVVIMLASMSVVMGAEPSANERRLGNVGFILYQQGKVDHTEFDAPHHKVNFILAPALDHWRGQEVASDVCGYSHKTALTHSWTASFTLANQWKPFTSCILEKAHTSTAGQ